MAQFSIFSKNEHQYLIDKKSLDSKYTKNYVYQIKSSIKKKLNVFKQDLKLILEFDKDQPKKIRLTTDMDLIEINEKILRFDPTFIKEIIEIENLGLYYDINDSESIDNFIRFLTEAYQGEYKMLIPFFEDIKVELEKKRENSHFLQFKESNPDIYIQYLKKFYEMGYIYRGSRDPEADIYCDECEKIHKYKEMGGTGKYPMCPHSKNYAKFDKWVEQAKNLCKNNPNCHFIENGREIN